MAEEDLPIESRWSRRAKIIASMAVVLQLFAVVAEPLRFFSYGTTRGSSPAADPIRNALGPYVEFAFLNHGYFFFAPEPGPSHLMQCQLNFADGSTTEVRYPDKTAQRPRLLYHRYFMLAEFLNQIHTPPIDAQLMEQAARQEIDAWTNNRLRYERVRDSMQRHLVARFGAQSASIERVRHILPGSDVVLKHGLPLSDPSLYVTLPDTIVPSTLPPTQPNSSSIPNSENAPDAQLRMPPLRNEEPVESSS